MPALQDKQQPEPASAQQAALPSASDALEVAQQVSQQSAAPSILPANGISIDEQQQDTQPAEQKQSEETLFSPQEIAESPAIVSIDSSPQVSPQHSQAGDAAPLLQPPSTEPRFSWSMTPLLQMISPRWSWCMWMTSLDFIVKIIPSEHLQG